MVEITSSVITELTVGKSTDSRITVGMRDGYVEWVKVNENTCPTAFSILVYAVRHPSEFDELLKKMREVKAGG